MVGAKALGIPASCVVVRTAIFSGASRIVCIRPRRRISYLELSQGETTAGADTAVVLKGRASHNRSELVDRSGSEGSSLGLTSCASPRLLAGLLHSQYLCAK